MTARSSLRACLLLAPVTLMSLPLTAQSAEEAEQPLIKPLVDVRVRYEGVDQDPFAEEADAVTARARLGFETRKYMDTSLLAEGEFTWPLVTDYNSTTNGKTQYPIVADPENQELNRLQLTNASLPDTGVTVGRQRILLDDQRFVGAVAWRQNEQTFDALRVVNSSVKGLTIDASYIDQVNRVFTRDSPQGVYESESIVLNVGYALPVGKVTVFGYLLEFDPIAAAPAAVRDSTSTYGLRFAGERPAGDIKLSYAASYATQEERGDNPLNFDNSYYMLELMGGLKQWKAGVSYEVLEGNGQKGFATPLATLHKWQGWADKFLTTPPDGLEDLYLTVAWTAPKMTAVDGLSITAMYHDFSAERTSADYGDEINLMASAKKGKITGILKFADYSEGDFVPVFATRDTTKWWASVEYAF